MEDIWEDEDVFETSHGLVSVITMPQKTSLVAHRDLSQICTFQLLVPLDLNHH